MAETKEHVDGINRLESILSKMDDVSDVLKTKQLEGTTQIPDLQFMRKGKSYVLEYQCSPIGSEYERRHAIYASCGVVDIWLCGSNKYSYYCDDIYDDIFNYGYHHHYKSPSEHRNIPHNPKCAVARYCTGYFNPNEDQMYLRGQVLYRLSKSKCEYPASIYKAPIDDIRVTKYGFYGMAAFQRYVSHNEHYQSRDPYKSVKQHIQPMALFLEDYGVRGIVIDACSVPSRDLIGSIKLYSNETETEMHLKYYIDHFDVYAKAKKRTHSGKWISQKIDTVEFNPRVPAEVVRKTVMYLRQPQEL